MPHCWLLSDTVEASAVVPTWSICSADDDGLRRAMTSGGGLRCRRTGDRQQHGCGSPRRPRHYPCAAPAAVNFGHQRRQQVRRRLRRCGVAVDIHRGDRVAVEFRQQRRYAAEFADGLAAHSGRRSGAPRTRGDRRATAIRARRPRPRSHSRGCRRWACRGHRAGRNPRQPSSCLPSSVHTQVFEADWPPGWPGMLPFGSSSGHSHFLQSESKGPHRIV